MAAYHGRCVAGDGQDVAGVEMNGGQCKDTCAHLVI